MIMSKEKKLARINADPKLWLLNFVKIVDNNGDLVPFKLNEQQEDFVDNMTKYSVCLKSRQLGLSTLSLGLCLWMACNKPNTNYLVVSYKQDSSVALFDRLKGMYYSMPHDKYDFPKVKNDNRGQFKLDNGSIVNCVVAGLKELSRGSTYSYILLSEFAFYNNQDKMLLSIEQSLAKNEDSKIILECTANGFNYFQELYMAAYKGKSKYKAFFYPWFASATKKQFSYEHQQAEAWHRAKDKGRMLNAADLEPDELEVYKRGATLKQMIWRRWKLLDMSLSEFQQEYPSTPFEAFITSGFSVFDQSKIVQAIDNTLPALTYPDVSGVLPESLHRHIGKGLSIYHLPKQGKRVYGGVDVASGSGGDSSTIYLMDDDGVNVATFNSNRVPVHEFAGVVDALGKFYGYAFLCVERNSFGLPLLERLRKDYQYMNLYKHKTFDQKGKRKNQLGFLTTNVTKSSLIVSFKESFEVGLIWINDIETLEQMRIFVDKDGKTGNKRGENNHDDLVIAACLSVEGMRANRWYV